MTMSKWVISAGLVLLLSPVMGFAVAPVEDYSEPAAGSSEEGISLSRPAYHGTQSLSIPERLQRLEAKVDNLSQANATSRVEELQQTVQELRGELEKQTHELEVLSANQKSFYQDLNSRIAQQGAQPSQPTQATQPMPQAVAETPEADTVPVPQPKLTGASEKLSAPPTTAALDSTVSAAATKIAGGEQGLYQQGFALFKSKQYDRALTQFTDYVTQYPKGTYVVNAHFWMGEINYLRGKHSAAKKSFEIVAKSSPKSPKVPDALLKLAIIAGDMGQRQKAEAMLGQIQKQYPGSTAARLAMIRAQELRLSAH